MVVIVAGCFYPLWVGGDVVVCFFFNGMLLV